MLVMVSSWAHAQDRSETLERIRACSAMDRDERVECLDVLSRQVAAPNAIESEADGWIVSEPLRLSTTPQSSPLHWMPAKRRGSRPCNCRSAAEVAGLMWSLLDRKQEAAVWSA